MNQVGDGPEDQPTEGVVSLESLAAQMDSDEGETALDESEESEESDESEELEASEESDESEEEEQEEPTFTIKVDGKDVTLKQSELVEMAQKGTDYTQKTMAVAEERKAVEAERGQVKQLRDEAQKHTQETLARLEAYSQVMQAQIGAPPPVSLLEQDSRAYLLAKEQFEARKGQLLEARAAIQQLQDEQARERQAWIAEKAEATERKLKDTLPGWNEAMLNELASYAEQLGLTPQAAEAALLEPGFWQLVHKAKRFDALQAEKAKLKPVAQLPKVQKPGSTNQPPQLARRQEAVKRYNAAPSLNTLADLL